MSGGAGEDGRGFDAGLTSRKLQFGKLMRISGLSRGDECLRREGLPPPSRCTAVRRTGKIAGSGLRPRTLGMWRWETAAGERDGNLA